MSAPYKRRRSASLVRNLWVYRRLVAVAVLLGLVLWFIVINSTPVEIYFPFGFGPVKGTSGGILLAGVVVGSILTALAFTIFLTIRRLRSPAAPEGRDDGEDLPEDRPPSDYAAKTNEGFPDAGWTP